MHKKTRKWLALTSGLVMMIALLGLANAAQAATRSARSAANITPANITPADCTDYGVQVTANIPGSPAPALVTPSTTANMTFVNTYIPDIFCLAPVSGNLITIFDQSANFTTVAPGSCLALNSTTGYIYMHNPNGCGSTASYMEWQLIETGAPELWMLQNQYAPLGKPCLYDINGEAEYAACNPNSRADTFTI
jgi:hypothetical protein